MNKSMFLALTMITLLGFHSAVLKAQYPCGSRQQFQPVEIKPVSLSFNTTFSNMDIRYWLTDNARNYLPQPQSAASIETLVPGDNYALPWATINWSNVLWSNRVWRDIEVSNNKNEAFGFNPALPTEHNLMNILIQGVLSGKIKAYSAADDRFTKELTKAEFNVLLARGENGTTADFNPAKVTNYRIKEDWMYLDTGRIVVVWIVGIAPVIKVTGKDGTTYEEPMAWFFYPNIRTLLAEHPVYTAAGKWPDMNWDKLLDRRNFKGTILDMHIRPKSSRL